MPIVNNAIYKAFSSRQRVALSIQSGHDPVFVSLERPAAPARLSSVRQWIGKLNEVAEMPIVVTIEEMEGNLRKLLDAVRDGKHIVITEQNVAVALLNPLPPKKKRQFGALRGQFVVGKEFFDPLPVEELAAWE